MPVFTQRGTFRPGSRPLLHQVFAPRVIRSTSHPCSFTEESVMLKFLTSTIGIIFLIGLLVVVGILMLIF